MNALLYETCRFDYGIALYVPYARTQLVAPKGKKKKKRIVQPWANEASIVLSLSLLINPMQE